MMARTVVLFSLAVAAYSLWATAAPMVMRAFGGGEVSASEFGLPQDATETTAVDLGRVLEFAPFGVAEGQDIAVTSDAVQSEFVLLGITTTQTGNGSRAIISGGDVEVANYAVGDEIAAGMTLTAVFADHVVLSIDGQDSELYFVGGDMVDPGMLLVVPTSAEPVRIAPVDDTLIGRYRAEIMQDAPGLLQRLGLEVTEQGYRVTNAASVEIMQAGLQPGDLISTLNGKPLGDLATDPALFDEVAALGEVNLEVLRSGNAILMTFPLK